MSVRQELKEFIEKKYINIYLCDSCNKKVENESDIQTLQYRSPVSALNMHLCQECANKIFEKIKWNK
jgi:uncharacterized protein YlaI